MKLDLSEIAKEINSKIDQVVINLPVEDRAKINQYRIELQEVVINNNISLEQKQQKILEIQQKYGY